jgi:hypothetical protein
MLSASMQIVPPRRSRFALLDGKLSSKTQKHGRTDHWKTQAIRDVTGQ